MALHGPREAGAGDKFHDSSEDGLADTHAHLPRRLSLGRYAVLGGRSSIRYLNNVVAEPHQCPLLGVGWVAEYGGGVSEWGSDFVLSTRDC